MLFTVLSVILLLPLLAPAVFGRQLSNLETALVSDNGNGGNTIKSLNVSSCPGTISFLPILPIET
jgi:hypothetical protein